MVIPTPRLLLIALFGLVAVVLAATYDRALVVGIAWLIVTAALAVADVTLLPPLARLTWTRDHEPKLSLGAWNPVTLRFDNRSSRPVRLRVRDAVPPELIPEGESGRGACPPAATWQLTYQVRPTHRGDYRFGPVAARYLGPLGLAWRQVSCPLDDEVKVYPDLLAVRHYESLLRRGNLEIAGLHTARRWGSGTEFERLRDYTGDDEFRRINWPATARHHRPIAADYQVERSQSILLVLDTGRLMSTTIVPAPLRDIDSLRKRVQHHAPGKCLPIVPAPLDDVVAICNRQPGAPPKEIANRPDDSRDGATLTRLDYAVNASLLLAFVAQQTGDRVGLLAFADRVARYLPPRPGRRQFLALTDALYNLTAEPIETNYAAGLGYLALRNPHRSLAVVFTDLTESEAVEPLVAHVGHLARRHLVLVVTLRDPAIEALAALPLTTSQNVYERAVARRTLDDRDRTLRTLRQRGVLTLDVAANALSASVINRYLEIKARTRL